MTSGRRIIGILLTVLLCLMLVICALYVGLSIRAANRESAKQRIMQLRGELSYLHECAAEFMPVENHGAEVSEWLRERLGNHLFSTPWSIEFGGSNVKDSDLSLLEKLPEIRVLGASACEIGDTGMQHIAGLEKLEGLIANDTDISDASAHCWENLVNLKHLDLSKTKITDASVPELLKLRKLEYLDVHGTAISSAGIEKLRVSLPECLVK